MSRIGTLAFAAIVLIAAGCTDDLPTAAPLGASGVAPGAPTRAPNATILSSRTVSAIQLSVAERHSCALESDNSAVCWGSLDTYPSLSTKYSWVAAGEESDCGIRVSDGGIECWRGSAPGIPTGTFTRLSVGNGHACAIRTDKTLACWWGNEYGEASAPSGTFVDVDAGGDHTCAVTTDGTHTCWGRPENSDLDQFSGTPVTDWPGAWSQVSAGDVHSCGVRTDGHASCGGQNTGSQVSGAGTNSPYSNSYIQVSAGYQHTCGVTTGFAVVCWGTDALDQASPPSGTFTQVGSGQYHSCALNTNGNVWCWGGNSPHAQDVPYEIGEAQITTTTVSVSPTTTTLGSGTVLYVRLRVPGRGRSITTGTMSIIEGGTCTEPAKVVSSSERIGEFGESELDVNANAIGTHTVTVCYSGADGLLPSDGSATYTVTAAATTTTVSVSPPTQQYSDRVSLEATVSPAGVNDLTASGTVQFTIDGVTVPGGPVALGSGGIATLANVQLTLAPGTYAVAAQFTSADPTVFTSSNGSGASVTVTKEDASILYGAANPPALQVSAPGGALNAGALSLAFGVKEKEPDVAVAPGTTGVGDISTSGLSVTLLPVGPGSSYVLACTLGGVTGTGYAVTRSVTCTNAAAIAVNVYEVQATVTGAYYTAGDYTDVFTVYDPSLGFATGGGTLLIDGDVARFGINLKYKKSGNGGSASGAKGTIVVVRKHADGTTSELTSNALSSDVAIGEDPSVPMGWAAIAGKATYTTWNAATSAYETVGGQPFTLYVEDRNNPGTGTDRVWVGGPGALKLPGTPSTARANAVALTGGNVSAPHRGP